jgi:single-stranded DNA-binding protein
MKLPTRSGLPVQPRNEVLLEGYFNNPKLSTVSNGSQRIGFDIVVESPIFQSGGQPRMDPNTGQQAMRNVRFRCQAWGQQAVQLAQYPEGTPLRISGALNRWSVQNGGRFTWYTDVKVLQADPL